MKTTPEYSKYEKNVSVLKEICPEYVEWLEKEEDADWIELIRSKNKDLNFVVRQPGKVISAYPIDNARRDSRKLAKNLRLHNEEATVLVGLGLGHLLNQIKIKKEKKHHILVVEPTAQLVRESLKLYDFSKEIENGTFLFIRNEADLASAFSWVESFFVKQNWHMVFDKFILQRPGDYDKLIELTSRTINQIISNIGTVMGAGEQIADNDIINLPYIFRHRGINELTDLYKDKPAVLIGTGPSLTKNVHRLKELQGKVVIIAVAQALRALLAYDVRPDFICTVDYGKTNLEHFKGLMDSNVPLIALNRTYAEILKRWQGPKFIVGTAVPGFSDTTVGIIERKGQAEQGGSVIHLCMGAALNFGCNPIAMIGHDLSFPEGKESHIPTADAGGHIEVEDGIIWWVVDDPRSHLHRKKKEKRYSHGPVQLVPGYYGGVVLTNMGLNSFITSTVGIMKNHPDKEFYDCTEGGAKLKGAKQYSLKKYLSEQCKDEIDKSVIEPYLSLADDRKEILNSAIPLLQDDIELMADIIKAANKGLKAAKYVKKAHKENRIEDIKKGLDENWKWSNKAHELAKRNNLIGVAIFKANRNIYGRKYNVSEKLKLPKNQKKRDEKYTDHLIDNRDDLEIRIEGNEMILKAVKKAAVRLKKLYTETFVIMVEFKHTNDESLLVSNEKEAVDLSDAEDYFKVNNWAHPLVDVRKLDTIWEKEALIQAKALSMRDKAIKLAEEWAESEEWDKILEYNDLIEEAQRIGREDRNFDEATELLEKAIELIPDRFDARWGLATAYHHIGKTKESEEIFKKLTEDFPDNHRLKYEYGHVLIRSDLEKGLKIITDVMKETEEFDYLFHNIGRLFLQSGKIDEAIDSFKKYLKLFPANYEVMLDIAHCYKQLGVEWKEEYWIKRANDIKPCIQ
jgi:hypothetical protein